LDVALGIMHHQFIWVSATVSKNIAHYIETKFPDTVQAFSQNVHRSVNGLRQEFLFGATGRWKERLLLSCLKKRKGERTIIFCNGTERCKFVDTFLKKAGYKSGIVTSDMPSKRRTRYFQEFDIGKLPILVSTDLVSRGIDTKVNVSHVILFDFPNTAVDYLHRVGRTARAGTRGTVSAFVGKQDEALACRIRDAYKAEISLENVSSVAPKIVKKKKNKIKIDTEYLDEHGNLKRNDNQKQSITSTK